MTFRKPILAVLATVFALMLSAVTTHAQTTDAATAAATVVVEPFLNVQQQQDLDFGSVFAQDGVTQASQAAKWLIEADEDATVTVNFSLLPSSLDDGSGNTVPVTYEVESAKVESSVDCGELRFDPATAGPTCTATNGGFFVFLGKDEGGTDEGVSVDVTGAPAATYTGTLELTATR